MRDVSTARHSLAAQLVAAHADPVSSAAQAGTNLANQKTLMMAAQQRLTGLKAAMAELEAAKRGEQRMAEIRTDSVKRSAAHISVFTTLIYICIPLLTLHVLKTLGVLHSNVAHTLFLVVFFVGLYIFVRKITNVTGRNNMSFQEDNPSILAVGFGDKKDKADDILEFDKSQLEDLFGEARDGMQSDKSSADSAIDKILSKPFPSLPTGGDGPFSSQTA